MKKLAAGALFVVATCFANEARADEWYGWQTLASDAGTVAVTLAVAKTTKPTALPIIVGATGYLAVPVTIHLLHDEPVRALGSGGLRLGAPLVCGVAGALILSSANDNIFGAIAGAAGAVFGLTIGAVVASVIDAGAIAYETKDAPPPTTTQPLTIGGSF